LANEDVRRYAKFRGVPQWKIAEHLGISEPTLGRRLRHEFGTDEKSKYIQLIDEIGGVNDANAG
jgi:hypothetical protein